jgi:bifunctional non-homologous end joining protein LigD
MPDGMYGAGAVVIWDKGRFEIQGGSLRQGKLDLFFRGKKIKGAFALIRMSGKEKEWLLIKKRDEHADNSFELKTNLPA